VTLTRRLGRLAALTTVVGVASGCIPADGTAAEAGASPATSVYAAIVDDASESGASDAQMAQLHEFIDGRELPFSEVVEAGQRTEECLVDVGLQPVSSVREDALGDPWLDLGWIIPDGVDEATGLALGDQCAQDEFIFINDMYRNQPARIELEDAAFRDAFPTIRNCLAEHGVVVDAEASQGEVVTAIVGLLGDGVDVPPECFPPGM